MADRGGRDRNDPPAPQRAQRPAAPHLGRRFPALRGWPRRRRVSTSTNTHDRAPRQSASMPSAPVPANRSSTASPSSGPRIENSASRTRSAVGRTSRAARRLERATAVAPCDDPHAATGCASTSASRSASSTCSGSASSGSAASRSSAAPWARSSSSASSGSWANVKRARPDWRVPVSSPSPRSSRSISASLKPSRVFRERLQARRVRRPEQQAERRRARRGRRGRAAGAAG